MSLRADCATCGQLDIAPGSIVMVAYNDKRPTFCLFRCCRCGQPNRRDNLTGVLVQALRNAGAREVRLRPEIPRQREPLTLDDLIDLGLDLGGL